MNCEQAKSIGIPEYLARKGYEPKVVRSACYFYLSMFSNEKTPSFEVSSDGRMFHDWSTGEKGNIINLAMLFCKRHSVSDGLRDISDTMGAEFSPKTVSLSSKAPSMLRNAYRDVQITELREPALLAYLRRRKISKNIAVKYCQQAYYHIAGQEREKPYFAIAWANNSGGYELRNAIVKQAMSPKDITIIGDLADSTTLVFEGFFDFLSAASIGWFREDRMNAVILNSTSELEKSFDFLSSSARIVCLLDNDEAGRKATNKIKAKFPTAIDRSVLYKGFNDVNEMLCHA